MGRITYSPADCVFGCPKIQNASVQDFWKWAYADLCDDDVKGVYAEWIVEKLLGVESPRRIAWANSDIITPGGTRIEVKSTAHWQTWKFLDERGQLELVPKHMPRAGEAGIRFGGLKARDSTSVDWSKAPTFKSGLYVFAFQKERTIEKWNALDLSQWEFFLVKASDLEQLKWKSISLTRLRKQCGALSASELAARGRAAIQELESADKSV
jgi:hypothetical protein